MVLEQLSNKADCKEGFLGTFTTDTPGQLDVLGHDGDTLGVDSAQVGIFEKSNQVSLRCFLESHDGGGLETQVSLEVLGDLTDQTLEGQLADQKFGGLLVTTDLTKSHGTGTITMGLLDSTGGGGALTGSLGGQLFTGSLSSGRLTGGLLGTGHGLDLTFKSRMSPSGQLREFINGRSMLDLPRKVGAVR